MNQVGTTGGSSRTLVWLAIVCVVAVIARVGLLSARGPQFAPDTTEYSVLAWNLAEHGAYSKSAEAPFEPSVRRPPLYPALIAVFAGPDGLSFEPVIAVQIAADAFTSAAVVWLAAHVAPLPLAVVAGLMYALHPGASAASTSLWTEATFVSLLTLGVCLLTWERGWRLRYLGAGIVIGMSILSRPIVLLLAPVLFVETLATAAGGQRRRAVASVALASLGLAIVVGPWAVRCTMLAGRLVLVQSPQATNFYVPTKFEWDQRNQDEVWTSLEREPVAIRIAQATTPRDIAAADAEMWKETLANIRRDWRPYLRARARTIPRLFLTSFDIWTGFNESFGSLWQRRAWWPLAVKGVLLLAFAAVPFGLAVLGAAASWRSRAGRLAALVWLYTLLIHVPMWIEYRYWLPAVPFMLVSASAGTALIWRVATRTVR